ncbi:hypothetical protein PPACK8108_LOCUS2398, partial [Phakopsora pachyrhizi]
TNKEVQGVGIAVSPDSTFLGGVGGDRVVSYWDATTCSIIRRFQDMGHQPEPVAGTGPSDDPNRANNAGRDLGEILLDQSKSELGELKQKGLTRAKEFFSINHSFEELEVGQRIFADLLKIKSEPPDERTHLISNLSDSYDETNCKHNDNQSTDPEPSSRIGKQNDSFKTITTKMEKMEFEDLKSFPILPLQLLNQKTILYGSSLRMVRTKRLDNPIYKDHHFPNNGRVNGKRRVLCADECWHSQRTGHGPGHHLRMGVMEEAQQLLCSSKGQSKALGFGWQA